MATNRVEIVLDAIDNLTPVVNKAISGISNAGKSLTRNVTAPILGAGVAIAKVAGDFQAEMNRVAALTGATGTEFESLNALAKELGATTQFSATDAAAAMSFLGATGYSTNEILSALPSTLSLASATTTGLAKTGDILTNIMQGYGLAAEDAGRATDVLAKAFTTSNLGVDLSNIGTSFKYVGPVAKAAGYEFEETAALIGLLGNAGYQGSKAGTTLTRAISNLAAPTGRTAAAIERLGLQTQKADGGLIGMSDIIAQLEGRLAPLGVSTRDANGNLVDMDNFMSQLKNSGADVADMLELFGTRAGPGMIALLDQGSEAIRAYTGELQGVNVGFVDEIAAVQMEGFNGALKSLRSALEGLAIEIAGSGLLDFLTSVVDGATEVIRGLTQLNPRLLKVGTVVAAVAAAAGPLLIVIGAIGGGISTILGAISFLAPAMAAIGTAIAAIASGPVLPILAAIAGAGLLIWQWWQPIKLFFAELWQSFTAGIQPVMPAINELKTNLMALGRAIFQLSSKTMEAGSALISIMFPGLKSLLSPGSQFNSIVQRMGQLVGQSLVASIKVAVTAINGIVVAIKAVVGVFTSWMSLVSNVAGAIANLVGQIRNLSAASSTLQAVGSAVGRVGGAVSSAVGRIGGAASGYTPATSAGRALNSAIGTAATGLLPGGPIGALLGAAIQERRQAPAGSDLLISNTSEAILTQPQQSALVQSMQPQLLAPRSQVQNQSRSMNVNIGDIIIQGGSDNAEAIAQKVIAMIEEQFAQYQAGFLT